MPATIAGMTGAPMRRRRTSAIPNAGERILRARTRLNITREELATGAGVSDRAIAGWERDGKTPNAKQLGLVANYLRTLGEDLYEPDVAPPRALDENILHKIRYAQPLNAAEAERVAAALERQIQEEND